jgi:hypothetical protein
VVSKNTGEVVVKPTERAVSLQLLQLYGGERCFAIGVLSVAKKLNEYDAGK